MQIIKICQFLCSPNNLSLSLSSKLNDFGKHVVVDPLEDHMMQVLCHILPALLRHSICSRIFYSQVYFLIKNSTKVFLLGYVVQCWGCHSLLVWWASFVFYGQLHLHPCITMSSLQLRATVGLVTASGGIKKMMAPLVLLSFAMEDTCNQWKGRAVVLNVVTLISCVGTVTLKLIKCLQAFHLILYGQKLNTRNWN